MTSTSPTGRRVFSVLCILFVIFLVGAWGLGDVEVERCVPVHGGILTQRHVDVLVIESCVVENVVKGVLVVVLLELVNEVAAVTRE